LAILKQSDRLPYDNDFPFEEARYPGGKNKLTHYRRWFAVFPCNYDLRMFPFDQQNCELTFKMRNAIKAQVLIVPGNIVYKGAKSVVEFIVNNYTMVDAGGNRDTKKLVVHFIRQPNYYITSCFIPTFMLGTLAYFTFFIHIDDFNDRFMGSLTALLVLASMMPVFTEGLPKASYTKLIDVWLLFFLISTTINITIHIVVDYLRKKELEDGRVYGPRPQTVKVIHNGQKIYPLKDKEKEAFEEEPEEEEPGKPCLTAKGVNMAFILFFPAVFVVFVGYMLVQVQLYPAGMREGGVRIDM